MNLPSKAFFRMFLGSLVFVLIGSVFVVEVSADHAVNINTATLEELDTLPGVGPATAQNIINARPYAIVQEISRADGIGEPGSSSYNNLIDHITVGETSSQSGNGDDQNTSNEVANNPEPTKSSSVIEVKVLKLTISGDTSGVIGQPLEFRAETNSDQITVTWVFGDGSRSYGSVVEHTYEYSGEYVVVASVSNSGKRVSSRMNVKIFPDSLEITVSDQQRVEITNRGNAEINLYGRTLVINGQRFDFPEDTIIKGGQKISFPSSVTGLTTPGAILALSRKVNTSSIDRTVTVISEDNQRKIAEIYDEILALQIKQMELKNSTMANELYAESQLASVAQVFNSSSTTDIGANKVVWWKTLKKFFGFK